MNLPSDYLYLKKFILSNRLLLVYGLKPCRCDARIAPTYPRVKSENEISWPEKIQALFSRK